MDGRERRAHVDKYVVCLCMYMFPESPAATEEVNNTCIQQKPDCQKQ